jgi:hypothetical protein
MLTADATMRSAAGAIRFVIWGGFNPIAFHFF